MGLILPFLSDVPKVVLEFDSRGSQVTQQAGMVRPPSRERILVSRCFALKGTPPTDNPRAEQRSALGPHIACPGNSKQFLCPPFQVHRADPTQASTNSISDQDQTGGEVRCFPDPALDLETMANQTTWNESSTSRRQAVPRGKELLGCCAKGCQEVRKSCLLSASSSS